MLMKRLRRGVLIPLNIKYNISTYVRVCVVLTTFPLESTFLPMLPFDRHKSIVTCPAIIINHN